tara:strand:+ start:1581 stop:2111 length:531 start_codon:yes stop_codon:yes gene_type:complete
VIAEDGEQIGVIDTSEAIRLADERGVDLVEVAPGSNPPVCRLLDYGRFRYLQAKRDREARKTRKTVELAEMRFRPRIGAHDIESKVRTIRKLLNGGDKVKVSVMFRGREREHPEIGVGILKTVAESLDDMAKVERPPAMEGRLLSITLAPASAAQQQSRPATADEKGQDEEQTEDA